MASVLETVRNQNVSILRLLLAVPGCVRQQELDLAVLHAAKKGYQECIELLLAAGADLNKRDSHENTLLKLAAEAGHVNSLNVLIKHGADVNALVGGRGTALLHAAKWGFEECVVALIRAGAKADLPDMVGNTPLLLAARSASQPHRIMKHLLEKGCDVNKQDGDGRTALHYCAARARGVALLLSEGADPNIQDMSWNAPIHVAATEGFSTVIENLLSYDCDPDLQNDFGKTALHYAAMKNHADTVDDIVDAGGNLNLCDSDGRTPLWYAVNHNRPEAVKALLKGNCSLETNTLNSDQIIPGTPDQTLSNNPFKRALELKCFKLAKLLVLAGCDVRPLYRFVSEAASMELTNEEKDDLAWFEDWIHTPHTLRQQCRISIRRYIGHHPISKQEQLHVPQSLRDYITLQEVDDHHIETPWDVS